MGAEMCIRDKGLNGQFRTRTDGEWLEVASHKKSVSVPVVDANNEAVLHFLFLLDELSTGDRDGQPLFNDQPVASRRDEHIAIGLLAGDHVLCIDSGLRRREGIVAEAHSISLPAIRRDQDLRGLHPPAADRAVEKIRASQALQLGNFDHAKAVFIPDRGIQALNGDAAAPFDAEAALEVDV